MARGRFFLLIASVQGALQLQSLGRRSSPTPLPPDGFEWASSSPALTGLVVPTNVIEALPKPCSIGGVVSKSKELSARQMLGFMVLTRSTLISARFSLLLLVSALRSSKGGPLPPDGFEWGLTSQGGSNALGAKAILAAFAARSILFSAQCRASLAKTMARLKMRLVNSPDATIVRDVATAAREYSTAAALQAAVYYNLLTARLKTYSPEACATFADLGRGVAFATREYSTAAALQAVVCCNLLMARLKTYSPEAAATFAELGRGVTVALREYYSVIAAEAAVCYNISATRFQTYSPAAAAALADIGRGVAASASRYYSAAAVCYKISATRLKTYSPDAAGTFVDIGLGVGAAARDYSTATKAQMGAAMAAMLASPNWVVKMLKVAWLRREGAARVAERAELAAALKVATLRRQGRAAVGEREGKAKALKLATLKREGKARVDARTEVQAALNGRASAPGNSLTGLVTPTLGMGAAVALAMGAAPPEGAGWAQVVDQLAK